MSQEDAHMAAAAANVPLGTVPVPVSIDPALAAYFQHAFQQQQHAFQQQTEALANQHHNELNALYQEVRSLKQSQGVPVTTSSSMSSQPLPGPVNSRSTASQALLNKLFAKMKTFRGELGDQVYDWAAQLENVFEDMDGIGEKEKISIAKHTLEGEALKWWTDRKARIATAHERSRIEKESGISHVRSPNEESLEEVTTWPAFKEIFILHYSLSSTSDAARQELRILRQEKCRSLVEYCERFASIAQRIHLQPGQDIQDELVANFREGLSHPQVRLHLLRQKPVSLFAATRDAQAADKELRITQFDSRPNSRSGHNDRSYGQHSFQSGWNRHYSAHSGTAHSNDTSTPMDLSFIQSEGEPSSEKWNPLDQPESGSTSPLPLEDEYSEEPPNGTEHDLSEINVMDRGRRRTDRSWRTMDKSQKPAGTAKCWCCNSPDHRLNRCPEAKECLREYREKHHLEPPSSSKK
jgi:hypothetical protein